MENKEQIMESLLERAQWLVGNPGTNISGGTDLLCEKWQEDLQDYYKKFNIK